MSVLEKNVNNHLDKCLAEQKGEIIPVIKNSMQPMKQPIYHLLKDSEIKKKLKDHGLEFKGNRKVLEQRLKNFITLWNSQCDLDKPLNKLEMIMKLKREEKKIVQPQISSALNFDCKTDPKEIEAKQKSYVNQHKNHFALLTEKAKGGSNLTKDIGELDLNISNVEIVNTTPKRKQNQEVLSG